MATREEWTVTICFKLVSRAGRTYEEKRWRMPPRDCTYLREDYLAYLERTPGEQPDAAAEPRTPDGKPKGKPLGGAYTAWGEGGRGGELILNFEHITFISFELPAPC